MKKIILLFLLIINFGVTSNALAGEYWTSNQECQKQRISQGYTGISQSNRCAGAQEFSKNVNTWAVTPIKNIFKTLLTVAFALGAVALFLAPFPWIFKEENDYGESKSAILGWLGLLIIVPLLIVILNIFPTYSFFWWVFIITFFGFLFVVAVPEFIKDKTNNIETLAINNIKNIKECEAILSEYPKLGKSELVKKLENCDSEILNILGLSYKKTDKKEVLLKNILTYELNDICTKDMLLRLADKQDVLINSRDTKVQIIEKILKK